MPRQSPAIRSAKVRSRKEENERQRQYEIWLAKGEFQGRQKAEAEYNEKIQMAERKANIELARCLGQLVEAVARAVVAMTTEKGLRDK